jgi:hypothetical protein
MSDQTTLQFPADTRAASYQNLIAEGKELKQEEKLYGLYQTVGDLTDRAAAELMEIPEARVSARRNKLIDDKFPVVAKGTIQDKVTKRSVHVWGIQS